MRVALIGPLPPELGGAVPGGVATHQAYLADGLAALPDMEVSLLATNATSVPPLSYAGVGMRRLDPRQVGTRRFLRYLWHVRRHRGSRRERLEQLLSYQAFLSRARPDVVHVQHPLERLYLAHRVARLEGKRWPLVVTAHSFFGEHSESVIHEFMAPNLRVADRVIAVNPHIADQAVQLGVERGRIRVIRSGIDVKRYEPRSRTAAREALGIGADVPLVLFVGNLEPRKQVHVLLQAFTRVRLNLPSARLTLVGAGDEADTLRQLARELDVADGVLFVGRVDQATLLHWYAAADVFTLPSSSEAQGIVALEAMACGLPVVAAAVGGLLGTIDDGRTGYLVAPGDAEQLAARLSDVLADPQRRQAIGVAARDTVSRDFTWQRAVEDTVAVYRELVACPTR